MDLTPEQRDALDGAIEVLLTGATAEDGERAQALHDAFGLPERVVYEDRDSEWERVFWWPSGRDLTADELAAHKTLRGVFGR